MPSLVAHFNNKTKDALNIWLRWVAQEPKEYLKSGIDYQHYIDKQIKPAAEAILPFIGLDLKESAASN